MISSAPSAYHLRFVTTENRTGLARGLQSGLKRLAERDPRHVPRTRPPYEGAEGEVDGNGASARQPVGGGAWLMQLAGFHDICSWATSRRHGPARRARPSGLEVLEHLPRPIGGLHEVLPRRRVVLVVRRSPLLTVRLGGGLVPRWRRRHFGGVVRHDQHVPATAPLTREGRRRGTKKPIARSGIGVSKIAATVAGTLPLLAAVDGSSVAPTRRGAFAFGKTVADLAPRTVRALTPSSIGVPATEHVGRATSFRPAFFALATIRAGEGSVCTPRRRIGAPPLSFGARCRAASTSLSSFVGIPSFWTSGRLQSSVQWP